MLFYILMVLFFVGLDQITKVFAIGLQNLPGNTFPIWQDVFHLTYVENIGAAFGILQNQRWLFVILTGVILCVGVVYLYKMRHTSKFLNLSITLFMAGAIGNMIDRIFRGYVIDFFEVRLINFAVFNVADSCLVIGAICICACLLFGQEVTLSKQDKYHDLKYK